MKSFNEICAEVGHTVVCPITPQYVWIASKNGVKKTCLSEKEARDFSSDVKRHVVNEKELSDWSANQWDLKVKASIMWFRELKAQYQNDMSDEVFLSCFERAATYAHSTPELLDSIAARIEFEIDVEKQGMENEII